MKKYIIAFLLFGILSLFAQNKEINTFNSFVNNEIIFKLFHANSNFVDIKIERNKIGLPTKNHIRKIEGLDLGKRSAKNNAFIGELVDTIFTPGKYEYVEIYTLTNNEGVRIQGAKKTFYVNVAYPKLASPDIRNERDTLFLGEDFNFSIAATGYDNLGAYKYIVKLDGNVVDFVKEATSVYLSKYLEKKENAGKTLQVDALYNGRPFKYYGNKGSLQSSNWEFKILKPNPTWLDQSIGDNQSMIIIDGPTYEATNTFEVSLALYYYGIDGNKRIFIFPDISDAVEGQNKYKIRWENGKVSSFIRLGIELNKIPIEEETDFNFMIIATTKFGKEEYSGKQNVKIYRRK